MKTLVVSSILVAFTTLAATPALAGDCKNVVFKVTNGTNARIKLKSVSITGNEGSWTEDVGNKEIETNHVYATGKQDLQKLDSGKNGTFKVNYDYWDAANHEWDVKSQTFSNLRCDDNKTFAWTVTNR